MQSLVPNDTTNPQGDPPGPPVDVREIELRATETHLQWRRVGDVTWIDLLALSEIEGAAGAPGPTGPAGSTGATGPVGPTGAAGAAGRTILSGSGVPSSGTGANGDFYLDTAATRFYGPKTAGVWGAGVALVGATGPTGAQGATGPQGPAGPQGAERIMAASLTASQTTRLALGASACHGFLIVQVDTGEVWNLPTSGNPAIAGDWIRVGTTQSIPTLTDNGRALMTAGTTTVRGINKVIHIAVRTDGKAGSGTAEDPFDGSTAAKFDAIFDALPLQAEIILGAGAFETNGSWGRDPFLTGGSYKIRGAGINATTVKLAANRFATGRDNILIFAKFDFQGRLDNFSIGDITLDCNRANQSGFTTPIAGFLGAIKVFTKSGLFHDMLVKDVHSHGAVGENFPCMMDTDTADAVLRMRNVTTTGGRCGPGGLTHLALFCQSGPQFSGSFENCRVVGETGGLWGAGFGAGSWRQFTVTGCSTENVGAGLVIDTYNYADVVISNCVFRYGAANGWGVLCNGGGTYSNMVISNNVFVGSSATQGAPIQASAGNYIITGNWFKNGSELLLATATGVLSGNYIDDTLDVNAPNMARLGNGNEGYAVQASSLAGTTLVINNTTPVAGIRSATATIDLPELVAGEEYTATITVTGASTTGTPSVHLGFSAALPDGLIFKPPFVSGANTISIPFRNVSTGDIDPPSLTVRATVMQF